MDEIEQIARKCNDIAAKLPRNTQAKPEDIYEFDAAWLHGVSLIAQRDSIGRDEAATKMHILCESLR